MFTYFHCYLPETWDAQIKAGLVTEHFGIRFSQSIDVEKPLSFNILAAKGGELYRLVNRTGCPFYIDRLQGGCYIEEYPYDTKLVNDYRRMSGENFYGFQMHEWSSNYGSDLGKLERGNCPEWTEKAISDTIYQQFPFPHLFLESMNAQEMAELGKPQNATEYIDRCKILFAKRQKQVQGDLLPCDSANLPFAIELQAGATRLMVEIGAQTTDTRIQIAYARGMAKATGKEFGCYYEPWGGDPFSACSYQRDGKNEWNIHSGVDFPFETKGEEGGSSRSLQRRLHLVSYMAGAGFISEEWGMCNTFYDWKDFELTPYGLVKKQFIDFTRKYNLIGTPVIPAAVVLPACLELLPSLQQPNLPGKYLGYPIDTGFQETLTRVMDGLRTVFRASGEMKGTECASLFNSTVPDAVDIVREDFFDSEKYEVVIDLTDNGKYSTMCPQKTCNPARLKQRLEALLPVTVQGFANSQLTRCEDGSFYLLLTNNSGVIRSVKQGEIYLPEAAEPVTVTVKQNRQLIPLEGPVPQKQADGYHVVLPAGGYFFGKIG